jgi:hypothetical protein
MLQKPILRADRLRRVPAGFSWVDHRLVRQNHFPRAAAAAWGLYLVLVAVGDEYGRSYYGDERLGRMLSLSAAEIAAARRQLESAGMIAFERPFYQVLSLEETYD